MSIDITQALGKRLNDLYSQKSISKKIKVRAENESVWRKNRHIWISTYYSDDFKDCRYLYHRDPNECYIALELKSVFNTIKLSNLLELLKEAAETNDYIVRKDDESYQFFRNISPNNPEELYQSFSDIENCFDNIFKSYLFLEGQKYSILSNSYNYDSLNLKETYYSSEEFDFIPAVPFLDIHYEALSLPSYQRTYKWGTAQVNQLINDILLFTQEIQKGINKAQKYHLGTLIINNGDIVDGQQRLVTLSLILYVLSMGEDVRVYVNSNKSLQNLFPALKQFFSNIQYKADEARYNIACNYRTILEREQDMGLPFFKTLIDRCQFAIVNVPHRAEAFQFFDCQNVRGKKLLPHDLLKAYHLREIPESEKGSCDYKKSVVFWQKICGDEKKMSRFFLCLYRIRKWSQGTSATSFVPENIGTFKGVTLNAKDDAENFPLYKLTIELLRTKCYPILSKDNISFPYQLDDVTINGIRFFDFVYHYYNLYEAVTDSEKFANYFNRTDGNAYRLMCRLNHADHKDRTGDCNVRDLFDAALLYYIDKFGQYELDKAINKIFLYAYSIRLLNSRVPLATVNNVFKDSNSIFRIIRNAKSPNDILNLQIESVKVNSKHIDQSKIIIEEFKNLSKIIDSNE